MQKKKSAKLFLVPHMSKATGKKVALEVAKELERHIAVAQRAVDASNFLPIHGFLTERQAMSLASRVKKYLWQHGLILVDKSWKQYVVLPADAYVRPKWKLVGGTPTRATKRKSVVDDG
jgi:hypothetical protein